LSVQFFIHASNYIFIRYNKVTLLCDVLLMNILIINFDFVWKKG